MKNDIITINNRVAHIRLPNELNLNIGVELRDVCLNLIEKKDEVHIVLVTGAADCFCCGCDYADQTRIADVFAKLPQPTLAAINGDAMDQGLEIALACDLRIAIETARFALRQVKMGKMPFDGATQRLPRIIGPARAFELIITGKEIEAHEALEIGLVNEVIAAPMWHERINKLINDLLSFAPWALFYAKEAIIEGMDLTLEQGLKLEADLYFLLHTTEDRIEGITAFKEKRPARFKKR
ncbi:MAG: enoyl-CoA hydratase-related protein [candidate division WOR-3 bacterium]